MVFVSGLHYERHETLLDSNTLVSAAVMQGGDRPYPSADGMAALLFAGS